MSPRSRNHGSTDGSTRYLHTLPDADETAVDGFSRIRNRSTKANTRTQGRPG